MLKKVHSVPGLRGMLLFIRATYAHPTTYMWRDQAGVKHRIVQAEGGEQGDPMMPLLFTLAIHDSLQEVKSLLDPRDVLLAFLDDVYVVSQDPDQVRDAYDLLGDRLSTQAGIPPPHWEDTRVEPSICVPWPEWPSWDLKFGTVGHQSVGDSEGSAAFVQETVSKRLRLEAQLWDAIHQSPTCKQHGRYSCSAQAKVPPHSRTLPPSQSEVYARSHDEGMERVDAHSGGDRWRTSRAC